MLHLCNTNPEKSLEATPRTTLVEIGIFHFHPLRPQLVHSSHSRHHQNHDLPETFLVLLSRTPCLVAFRNHSSIQKPRICIETNPLCSPKKQVAVSLPLRATLLQKLQLSAAQHQMSLEYLRAHCQLARAGRRTKSSRLHSTEAHLWSTVPTASPRTICKPNQLI